MHPQGNRQTSSKLWRQAGGPAAEQSRRQRLDLLRLLTPYIVGARTEVVVALDWTSFAADEQETIVLSMLTGHGRATPLLWKTVASSTLKGNQRHGGPG